MQVISQLPKVIIRSFTIHSCESSMNYKYINGKFIVESNWESVDGSYKALMTATVEDSDIRALNKVFLEFTKTKENELLLNNCINDGSNFKLYLYNNSLVKKIFLGNYYDARFDILTRIFQKYLDRNKVSLFGASIGIGYGSEEDIKSLVESQNRCSQNIPEAFRKWLLYDWCELPKK